MKLTLEIARRCSADGFLDLNEYEAEVTSIADEAAEFLSQKIDHSIDLYYLIELSDKAAKSLSKFKGCSIDLGMAEFNYEGYEKTKGCLTQLSDKAIEALSQFRGALSLDGLTSLTDAAAKSLSKHKGRFLELSDELADLL